MRNELKQIDRNELELPETTYIRDIESRVFQAITLQCLAKIDGISMLEGNLLDSLLGREVEHIKGIYVEQDQQNHSVNIRVEINIQYGISIPEKSEEIQAKIVKEVTDLTGLHVACVHVVFKNLIIPALRKKQLAELEEAEEEARDAEEFLKEEAEKSQAKTSKTEKKSADEYSETF